ncbi:hypothetical protein NQ318_003432 [Aromia moschata]|uniref:Uncharacterized protein n=1 Tax=Aromia moschata TaxID=1265417 RepID=A0AAV8YWG3_9CUCU|nr:hypothetical protein NQ318_003432 [Aromia moschata]
MRSLTCPSCLEPVDAALLTILKSALLVPTVRIIIVMLLLGEHDNLNRVLIISLRQNTLSQRAKFGYSDVFWVAGSPNLMSEIDPDEPGYQEILVTRPILEVFLEFGLKTKRKWLLGGFWGRADHEYVDGPGDKGFLVQVHRGQFLTPDS